MGKKTLAAITTLVVVLPAQVKNSGPVLARIGEIPVYESDLLPSMGAQLFQLKIKEYEIKKRALNAFVDGILLEREASGTGLSGNEFLKYKIKQVTQPTEAEIQSFHLQHADPIGRPIDQIRSQIVEIITRSRLESAREAYLAALRQRAGVTVLYGPPKVTIYADPNRLRGNPDAPVTISEFADYECPYCQEVETTIRHLLNKYESRIRLTFFDFPLKSVHPLSETAAEGSRCAGEQGKYWEYHDWLLTKTARRDVEGLVEHAQVIGLDYSRFKVCLESRKFAESVSADILTGYRSGVSFTPTFYINGIAVTGIQAASVFEKIIEAELGDVHD
jgi:protein-disulfide isomerase